MTGENTRDVETVEVFGLSNAEFIDRYAKPGRVGLVGGTGLLERTIKRAQRRQSPDRRSTDFSHAFLFQGRRHDGFHWVIESDLEILPERAQLGVQENRASKYHDEETYSHIAILDFGLEEQAVSKMLGIALDMLVDRTQYSVREVFALYFALKRPHARDFENVLAQDGAFFCSAFVQHLFLEGAGIDFDDAVHTKQTTPEDIARTDVRHVKYVLTRPR
jgi:hypothetical protein